MLREIRIRGLGTIEDVRLELAPGLNVLTGETGAGKTMVVSGLGLLLGERADAARVRHGTDQAIIEGLVEVAADHPASVRAEQAGADIADGLILTRTVSAQGRSRAFVGGRAAPVGLLAELGADLVAVHGQADQWRLRQAEQHRVMLDDFAGAPLAADLAGYEQAYDELVLLVAELEQLQDQARERARTIDMLSRALEEIQDADPAPGEDVRLGVEVSRLAYADDLRAAAQVAHTALVGADELSGEQETSVADLVGTARAALAPVTDADDELAQLDLRMADLQYLTADLAGDLASYHAAIDADPQRLGEVQQRIAVLARLQRTYGEHTDDVLAWAAESAATLDGLRGQDERLDGMAAQVQRQQVELALLAERLSAARAEAAGRLAAAASEELSHLAMPGAELRVEVGQRGAADGLVVAGRSVRYTRHGVDDVEILLAPSTGSTPAPIVRAASGGELSRVMLALEVVTASGQIPTLVFDEIDSGVGGAAALDVGARLARLARSAQVIVVTHFAQVAAYADRHLVVRKDDDGGVAVSASAVLDERERVRELVRMMSGITDSRAAAGHARELLRTARADASPAVSTGTES